MSDPSSIRFPAPLRQRVAAQAAAEHRTFSGEVRVLLEGALDAREAETAALLRRFAEAAGSIIAQGGETR